MRKLVTPFLLGLLLILSACNRGAMQTARPVDVADKFSLDIPSNLLPCNDLHDFAQLQYADERAGYFLVGIEEAKADIADLKIKYQLADYAYFVESTIMGAFDTMHVSQRDTLEVNGLLCQTADLYAVVNDKEAPLEVYYHIAVFESDDHFYQLIGWSPRDRQETFRKAAMIMDQSFQECVVPTTLQTASAQVR